MMKNVGGIDRSARMVVGLLLLALVFTEPQTAWGWIGLIPLTTGLLGWCPLYALPGFNTCPLSGKPT